jgi:glycosyltransferase involved in cell wall biosynthesis
VKKKLAIITSHPIQYNAPWFSELSREGNVQVKVFYTWSQTKDQQKYDPGFGRVVEWDIPLLEGYEYCFVNNTAPDPGTHHFKGIVNPSLNEAIEQWQPDAVLVFGWAFKSHLKCIRYFYKKKPVLFRGDSTLLDETKGWKTFLRRVFLKWVYSHVNYALYAGTNNKKYFRAHGLKEQQLVYAPHAIDNDRFNDKYGEYQKAAILMRKQIGFADNDVVLLFAGKLEAKKNPFFLVDLLHKINDSRIKVLFAGNGALEKELKEKVQGDKRFSFIDFQNQQMMPVLYRLADVFILPSRGPGETWGLALNEAMACGKPVVASDRTGGAIDLITNKNGLIIYNSNADSLVQMLQHALQDKNLLPVMGQHSAATIKNFSFKNITAALTILMSKLYPIVLL